MSGIGKPTVSVVIPAHDAALYLGAAITSVLDQSVAVSEIIVVDDGSTDDTVAIAEAFGAPVRVLRQDRAGANAARNRGVQASSGAFLTFLDADDLWEPAKVRLQLETFAAEPATEIVFGMVTQFRSPELTPDDVFLPENAERPMVGHHTGAMMLPREVFDGIGPFDSRNRFGQFVDWFARALEQGRRITVLEDVVMRRRLHLTNMGLGEDAGPQHYARALRGVLERRRAAGSPLEQT